MSTTHRLHFAKDAHKFSAAHLTLFPDGTKERLHGHNYQVETVIEVASIDGEGFLSFAAMKAPIKAVCDALHERVLLPTRARTLSIVRHDATEIEIVACGKRYVFPADEVVLLETDNVVTETLAAYVAEQLAVAWAPLLASDRIRSLQVTVKETLGQGASITIDRR